MENSSTFQADEYFDTYNRTRAYGKNKLFELFGQKGDVYKKSKLFELFRQKRDIYEIISVVGLNEKKLNEELQKEAMLPPLKL